MLCAIPLRSAFSFSIGEFVERLVEARSLHFLRRSELRSPPWDFVTPGLPRAAGTIHLARIVHRFGMNASSGIFPISG
jgi:hypothetical protein